MSARKPAPPQANAAELVETPQFQQGGGRNEQGLVLTGEWSCAAVIGVQPDHRVGIEQNHRGPDVGRFRNRRAPRLPSQVHRPASTAGSTTSMDGFLDRAVFARFSTDNR